MEFVRGYTKIDNSWWSEGGPFTRLTPDEQTILLYLATITIRTGPLYDKCGLLYAQARTDTIEKRCNIRNFRRWKAMKGLEEKGFVITIRKRGTHNLYLLGMVDASYRKIRDQSGYDDVKMMKEDVLFADSRYIAEFGKIPADIIAYIKDHYKDSTMIRKRNVERYNHSLFDILFNPEIPAREPWRKVVSIEREKEIRRKINQLRPNPFYKVV